MDLQLAGKNCIVTGGTRNLGRAISLALLTEGARVLAIYKDDGADAEQFLSLVPSSCKGSLIVRRLDVSTSNGSKQACGIARETFGQLDILVNNAATILNQTPDEITDEDFDWVMRNTLRSTIYMSRAAIRVMKASGGGRIVNMSTAGVFTANPRELVYLCAKAGVEAATRAFARLAAKDRITVNAIAPHVIDSGMGRNTFAEDPTIIDRIPLHRTGSVDELVSLVLYLASPICEYMTGQIIPLNGGRLMR